MGPPVLAPEDFKLDEAVHAAMARTTEEPHDVDEPELVPAGEAIPEPTKKLDIFAKLAEALRGDEGEQIEDVGRVKSQTSKHSHMRRRRRRAKEAEKRPGPKSIQTKKVALARLWESEVLHAAIDVENAMVEDTQQPPKHGAPLHAKISIADDAHVASTGFLGKRYEQTAEDRLLFNAHELGNQEGWQYIAWDGK